MFTGRGGAKINELQSDSGARIVVTKEELNGNVVVKLFGAEEVTNKAKELIEDVIGVRKTEMIEKQSDEAPLTLVDIDWRELNAQNVSMWDITYQYHSVMNVQIIV